MDVASAIGTIAAIASTLSFVPQAFKIIRTRDTKSISVKMYGLTVVGFALWTTYGCLLGVLPLIASNGISLCLSAFILAMKVKEKKNGVAPLTSRVVR